MTEGFNNISVESFVSTDEEPELPATNPEILSIVYCFALAVA